MIRTLQIIKTNHPCSRAILLRIDSWWRVYQTNFFSISFQKSDLTPEELRREHKREFLALNNGILEDLTVNTHVCRGNFHSTWASSGGYDSVSDALFEEHNVHAYYLEYDTDHSGDFKPLAKVNNGKKVVLELLTSKSGDLEDKDEVIVRIKEASQYVPLERLYLSPQCGFSSTEDGNILTIEAQWDKLKIIDEIVREVWK